MIKKHCAVMCAVLLAMLFSMAIAAGIVQAQVKTVKPLYQRLGGYDAIAAVVDDFVGRLATDPRFVKFFAGHSQDSIKKIRQHIVDQLCAATGGPCYYIGRDMKTAHAGLGITDDDWNASVVHLVATLDKFKVPQQEKDEVIGAIASMKDQIVEKSMTSK